MPQPVIKNILNYQTAFLHHPRAHYGVHQRPQQFGRKEVAMGIDIYGMPAVAHARASVDRYRAKIESGIGQAQTLADLTSDAPITAAARQSPCVP